MKCPACAGKGKAEEWLEIEEEPFTKLAQTAESPEENSLDRSGSEGKVAPAYCWSGRSATEAPEPIRPLVTQMQRSLALSAKRDRVESITFELYQSSVTAVTYELCGVPGTIDVQEWDKCISETPLSRKPLGRWRRRVFSTIIALLIAGIAFASWYTLRHPYFFGIVNSKLLWALVPILALCAFRPVSLSALPKAARRRRALLRSSSPAIAVVLVAAAVAVGGYPSVVHARQLASTGRVTDALVELDACVAVGQNRDQAAVLHDRIRLTLVRREAHPARAWQEAQKKFFSASAREAAESHALATTAQAARTALDDRDIGAAETHLGMVPERFEGHPAIRPLRFEAKAQAATGCIEELRDDCAATVYSSLGAAGFIDEDLRPLRERADEAGLPAVRDKWRTITSRARLETRLEACRDIGRSLRFLEVAGTGTDLPVTQERVDSVCGELLERQRLAEEQRREREEQAREAAREARWRAWAYAPLLCNDGSRSPTCVCGQRSRRGCCSWHKGVAGCSAPYPN